MQLIELLLTAAFAGWLIIQFFNNKKAGRLASISVIFIAGLHFFVEGMRWQMFPLYLLLIPAVIQLVSDYSFKKVRYIIPFTVIMLLSLFLGIFFPVFSIPAPTGDYFAGTLEFDMTDTSRAEYLSDDPDDFRTLAIKVWYPAEEAASAPESYWNGTGMGQKLAETLGLPDFIFDHVMYAKTNSFPDIRISQKKTRYPVILFSHGYFGFSSQNRAVMEELASRGYIIISIGHPYESALVEYQDGSSISYKPEILYRMFASLGEIMELNELIQSASADEKKGSIKGFVEASEEDNKSIGLWVKDSIFVINSLKLISDTYLDGRINTEKIGIFGHSFGGAAAAEVMARDSRITAGINIDGLQFGNTIHTTALTQPFMLLESKYNKDTNAFIENNYAGPFYKGYIEESGHFSFTDFPMMLPFMGMPEFTGQADSYLSIKATSTMVADFFDMYLAENSNSFSDFPNTEIRKIR